MYISAKVEGIDKIIKGFDRMVTDVDRQVLQPAINKVAEKARAEINRAIPEEFSVKATEVRNAIELRKARAGTLRAVISVFGSSRRRGRSMNMIHFLTAVSGMKTRGSKAKKSDMKGLAGQLGFQVKRSGGIKRIDGAFLGNNGRTIFRRTGDKRLPIAPVQVIGFSQMFNTKKINKRVMDKVRAELPVEVERAMARVLKGGR